MGTPSQVTPSNKKIILFDGVCNLCHGAVKFIIKRDPTETFLFASLQSEFGKTQLAKAGHDVETLQTILVVDNNAVYQQSDAALKIIQHLSGFWSSLYIFRFVPKVIRDGVYNFIARHRYSFFGKQSQCMIPSEKLKARFID
jgi:predicted DCC family thiol-disulfide oxidoreductase YuxK